MGRLFWVTLPLLLFALVVLGRALLRRPIRRYDLNVIVSLLLLVYLFTTASLGLFWVARMDLPVFDWHYLFGYCVLVLMAVHVWFQLPVIDAWLRKQSPPALLEADGKRWRRGVRVIIWSVALAAVLAVTGLIAYEFLRPKPRLILNKDQPIGLRPSNGRQSFALSVMDMNLHEPVIRQNSNDAPRRVWLQHRGQRMSGAQYIHEGTGISRWGVFRSPRFAGSAPGEFKSYPGKPTISLPAPRSRSGKSFTDVVRLERNPPATSPRARMTKAELADLLHYTYGVTEERRYPGGALLLRAAASAGALYPTDLYIAARNVEGIPHGVYYYHAANHALIHTGSSDDVERLALASAYHGWLANAPATVVLTVVYDRTVWKYRDRSYRYVMLDAAHVAGNLALAATALGIASQPFGLFDDRLVGEALGLSAENEGVVMMFALGTHSTAPHMRIPAFDLPDLPSDVGAMEMTRLAQTLTSVRWRAGSVPFSSSNFQEAPERMTGQTYTMPAGSPGRRDLFEVIQTRRSFREFARREVRFEDLAGITRECFLWNDALAEGGRWSQLYLVVRAVATLPAGVYRYNAELDRLEQVVSGQFSTEISSAGLSQELLERAAVVFVWTIDLGRVGTLHGERDYRYGCIEIGMSGERAYLAAGARGLGACGVGAFYDDEVEEVVRTHDSDRRVMYLMGIGQMR